MTPQAVFVAGTAAFVLGAVIGSFLNACIYRMPRDIRLDDPKRSFCPQCRALIPWYRNLPIVSWLALRGRCASCGVRIPIRYLLVELLTAGVFLWLWLAFGWPEAPAYWVFAALLIAATFIDFDFFIIPDEITIGGTVAGLLASSLIPSLMGATVWWAGLAWSALGAALGFGLLWLVVETGKLAFGKKRIVPDQPEPFSFQPDDENPVLTIGGEPWPWQEIFSRESDALVIECERAEVNGKPVADDKVRIYWNRLIADGHETGIEQLESLRGIARAVVIPREAMGFGDVKFIACIGAFLGWQAVLFTMFASSVIGAVIGVATLAATKGRSGGKLPFGPYLALGALLWLAVGPALVDWYFGLLKPSDPGW